MTRSRSILAFAVLLLAAVACQPPVHHEAGPTFTAEDEAAIRGMLERYPGDVLAQDWTAHVAYYSDDAVRMPPNEPMMQGHAAILAWDESRPPFTAFTLTPQVIEGDGDLAWARGTFTLTTAPPDAEPVSMVGKWHAIYERQADGSWLCVSDIWNADAPVAM